MYLNSHVYIQVCYWRCGNPYCFFDDTMTRMSLYMHNIIYTYVMSVTVQDVLTSYIFGKITFMLKVITKAFGVLCEPIISIRQLCVLL